MALMVWKKRWFCRYLCPTGVLCDAVSKCGRSPKVLSRIPSFSKSLCLIALILAAFGVPWLALLDPISLFYSFCDGFRAQSTAAQVLKLSGLILVLGLNFAVPYSWCQRFCPLGGLQDLCAELRKAAFEWLKAPRKKVSYSRRAAIAGLAGIGLGFFTRRLASARSRQVLRPPGALPEPQFKTTCIRCGNCVHACPTGVLKPSLDSNDWIGALTPQILFIDSYCLPECVQCGRVCPSGAIVRFSQEGKIRFPVGIARIQISNCLLTRNRECDRCKTYCAYAAIEIKKSEADFSAFPFVVDTRCAGCGACQIICPVEAIRIDSV